MHSSAGTYLTKADLNRAGGGRNTTWVAPALQRSDQILRGRIGFLDIEEGLSVHYSNAIDLHDLHTEAEAPPGLTISVFLEGEVEAWIGPMRIPVPGRDADGCPGAPVATIYAMTQPEKFLRQARRGCRLRKVSIGISAGWLEQHSGFAASDADPVRQFMREHLSRRVWTPGAHALSLAEQIIAPPTLPPFLFQLYLKGRVLGLIEEALLQVMTDQPATAVTRPPLKAGERQRLQAIDSYLQTHLAEPINTSDMARALGLSATSLQRLIRQAHGCSLAHHIRAHKLDRARMALERDGISVAEAAYMVGYNSPANFATAFRRAFGLPPSAVQDR